MVEFSPVAESRVIKMGDIMTFSSHSVDLSQLGEWASPIATLDHYRLKGRPFAPHVHVGFSAAGYVLEDSECAMRSRDILGNDIRTEPGGLIWTQAASGAIHEDTTFDLEKEMHGVQLFVNLGGENKLLPPSVLPVPPADIPVWRDDAGNSVRVLSGSFGGLHSPLRIAAPYTWLDAAVSSHVDYELESGLNLVVFVLEGAARVRAGGENHDLAMAQAIGVRGGPATVTVEADAPARIMILCGEPVPGPVFREGNAYIMADQASLDAAKARYESGAMGTLAPRAD